jgi:hypothetical protein
MILKLFAATAACLAVAFPCFAEGAASSPPPLPKGPLHYLSATPEFAQFFVGDLPKKEGDVVEVWMYYVRDPGVTVQGRPVMQVLTHKRIDCAARTAADLFTGAWDGAGRRVAQIPATTPQPIAVGSPLEHASSIACETAKAPEMTRVVGNRAAFTLGLQAIKHARERAGG